MIEPAPTAAGRRPWWREPGPWALLAVGLVVFWRPVFLGEVFYFRDLSNLYVFARGQAGELVGDGVAPLWNPLHHGGRPLLGEIHNAALYPTTLLYAGLDPWRALAVEVLLHVAGAALAAYALARRLGLGTAGAVVTGLVHGLSGYALSQVNLLVRLLGQAWTPVLLLLWDRWLEEGGRRRAAAVVAAGAVQVFAGAPEVSALTWTLMLGWALARPGPRRRFAAGAAAGGLCVATLLLASVQLLPTLEVLRGSERGAGFDFEEMAVWSLHPLRLVELIVPGLLGDPVGLPPDRYWGAALEGAYPYFVSLYLGALVPTLALLGVVAGRSWSRAFRAFLAVAAVVAVLLALGRHGLLLEPLAGLVPATRIFRYPVKLLGLGVLPLALLAGLGVERLPGLLAARGRHLLAAGGALAVLAAGAFLLVVASPLATPLLAATFQRADGTVRAGVAGGLGHAAAVVALGFAALLLGRRSPAVAARLPALFAALLAIDLATTAGGWNPTAPREVVAAPPAAVEVVRAHRDGGRLFSETPGNGALTLRLPLADAALFCYRWYQEVLGAVWVGPFGIPVVFHDDYTGLAPVRLLRLGALVAELPWERRLPLLAAGGVTTVATFDELERPELRRLAALGNASGRTVHLYRLETAARPFELATSWLIATEETTALRALLSPGFDPRRWAVVEGPEARPSGGGCATPPRVEVVDAGPLTRTVEVESDCPGYLVHAQTFDPGWEATLDGRPVAVVRANSAFAATFVDAGRHRVEWRYRPAAARRGALVSGSAALALLAAAVLPRRRLGPPPATATSAP